jgi:hypothetical protein
MAHYRKPLAAAAALNTAIFVGEAVAGFQVDSLSLLMDSVPMTSSMAAGRLNSRLICGVRRRFWPGEINLELVIGGRCGRDSPHGEQRSRTLPMIACICGMTV